MPRKAMFGLFGKKERCFFCDKPLDKDFSIEYIFHHPEKGIVLKFKNHVQCMDKEKVAAVWPEGAEARRADIFAPDTLVKVNQAYMDLKARKISPKDLDDRTWQILASIDPAAVQA